MALLPWTAPTVIGLVDCRESSSLVTHRWVGLILIYLGVESLFPANLRLSSIYNDLGYLLGLRRSLLAFSVIRLCSHVRLKDVLTLIARKI